MAFKFYLVKGRENPTREMFSNTKSTRFFSIYPQFSLENNAYFEFFLKLELLNLDFHPNALTPEPKNPEFE